MTWGIGAKAQCLLQYETTYGSDPSSAAALKLPIITLDLKEDQPDLHSPVIRNNVNPSKPFRGNRDANGSVVVPFDLNAIGYWLKLFFGDPNSSGSATLYTHTFTPQTTLVSAVIDKGFADLTLYYKFNGVMCNSMTLNFGGEGGIMGTFGLAGKQETKGTSAYDASPTDLTAISTQFEHNELSAEEGNSAISNLTQFNITATNSITPAYCIGDSGLKTAQARGMIEVTGNIVGLFENDTLLTKGRGQTETQLKITATDGTYSVYFEMDECTLSRNSPPIDTPGGLYQNLAFRSYYQNGSNACALKCVLANTRASY